MWESRLHDRYSQNVSRIKETVKKKRDPNSDDLQRSFVEKEAMRDCAVAPLAMVGGVEDSSAMMQEK